MSNDNKITRKLRAILSADVKGYSLLMADDEVHTIQTLKTYRSLMSDLIDQHSGRVVDNPGDNLLAEFSSAVDAVECAVQIQKKLKKENARYVEDNRLEFRIGINIGDVIHDGDRIYGEGVNIAARIESLSDAGGVCISRSTYDQIKNKLQVETEYLGEHEVKNIKEPVRVYRVLMDADTSKPLVEEQLELPDKPSIAVLSFDNMSGDPSQEYFSDGLTEQIISGLCKVSNLFVIARNSSFAYKGKAVSTKQIALELGVRYILEGSVQRAGDRVRITAQLIDATTDYHMWSKTYDRDMKDIFALQDEITIKLIEEMEVNLTYGEQAHLYYKDMGNIQAFDKLQKGMECFFRYKQQDNARARIYFEQASKLDNTSAAILASIGWTHIIDIISNWSDSPLKSILEAENNAQKAIALNDSLDIPHGVLAFIHLFNKEYDKAIYEAKQAVDLNPNGADAIANLGFITSITGEPDKGIILLKEAFRLNPIPLPQYYYYLGEAYRLTGQDEKAIEIVNRGIMMESGTVYSYLLLIVCYVNLDKLEKAKKYAKKVLEIDPNFSVEYYKSTAIISDQAESERAIEALRKAGIPD
jgi:adenylate cyclase